MLFDDIQELLKKIEPDIITIKTFWENTGIESRFHELEKTTQDEQFWQHPDQTPILKELQKLRTLRETYLSIVNTYADAAGLLELLQDDEQELAKLANEIHALRKQVLSFKITLLMNDPQDQSSCFLSINSGAGE